MGRMSKNIKKGIVFGILTIVSFVLVQYGIQMLQPLTIAQNAALQLEDSNTSYLTWKSIGSWFKLLYLLPVGLLITTIYHITKGGDK